MAGMMTLTLWTTSVLVTVFIAVNRYVRVCYSNALYCRVFSPPLVAVFCLAISSCVWLFTIEASAVFYPGLPGCFLHIKISPVRVVTLVTLYCLGYVLVVVLYCLMTSKVRRLGDKARPKFRESRRSPRGSSLQVNPLQERLAFARLSAAGFSEERVLREIPPRDRRALPYPEMFPIRRKLTSHNDFRYATQLGSSGETLKSLASRRNSHEGTTSSSREEMSFSPPSRKLSGENGGTLLKRTSEERRKISWVDMQPPAEEKVTSHRKISWEDKSCVRVGDEETCPSLIGYSRTSSMDRLSPLYVIPEERRAIKAKSEGDFRQLSPLPEVSGSPSKREVLVTEEGALKRTTSFLLSARRLSTTDSGTRTPKVYEKRIDNMTFGFVACTVNMTTCVPFIFCFVFNHLLGFGMPRQVECLAHLVLMCGSALNCVVYGAMNVSFSQSARKLLRRLPLMTAPSPTSPCNTPSHAVGGDERRTAIRWHVPIAPILWHRT
ncbi:hypothetical protein V1264_017437 [Littorina saxatilis]|uniref:G-protein coupled receptors family 1 profile domain-containing protein n=1 Tax=Littorina saxatilis TaxID=31220 RepID=A0AAN9BIK0_9CAEN